MRDRGRRRCAWPRRIRVRGFFNGLRRLRAARASLDEEIAQALSIRRSPRRAHLQRLFARLGLPGRQALRAGGLEDPAIAAGLRGDPLAARDRGPRWPRGVLPFGGHHPNWSSFLEDHGFRWLDRMKTEG
jgi:hypothetical protein